MQTTTCFEQHEENCCEQQLEEIRIQQKEGFFSQEIHAEEGPDGQTKYAYSHPE